MEKNEKIISIDIGENLIKWIVFNRKMKSIDEGKIKIKNPNNDLKNILKEVSVQTRALQIKYNNIVGVGISIPGIINSKTSVVLTEIDVFENSKDINIASEFSKYCTIPTKVINNANAATIGEKLIGKLKKNKSGIFITIDSGVGGGIIIDGNIYQGHSFSAGEVGLQLVQGTPWEKISSLNALISKLKEELKINGDISSKEIIELVKTNKKAKKIFHQWMISIADGLSNIIDITNPETIVLSGEVIMDDIFDLEILKSRFHEISDSMIVESTKITKSAMHNNASLYGVFAFAKKELLNKKI